MITQTGTVGSRRNRVRPLATPPHIGWPQILKQIKKDLYDKEVQSAATYSYLWLACQAGHLGLGVVVYVAIIAILLAANMLFGIDSTDVPWPSTETSLIVLVLICLIFGFYEYKALNKVKNLVTTDLFPIDHSGLIVNAITAWYYMSIGATLAWCAQFFLVVSPRGAGVGLFLSVLGLFVAFTLPVKYWLKQKIIWQKVGLPFLFRLANMHGSIKKEDADTIKEFLTTEMPPQGLPRQFIIHGPADSGRTYLAAGIGTELAFLGHKVRYITFDKFNELLANNTNYPGPKNIDYWGWEESQVLIIDDISPHAGHGPHAPQKIEQFFTQQVIPESNDSPAPLSHCHTIWIMGSESREAVDESAACISGRCAGKSSPVRIGLTPPEQEGT